MVAFEIFGWPIYWYGLFYLTTFVAGYIFLWYLGHRQVFRTYPGVHQLLTDTRDDLLLAIMLGVIVGGRLGHVLIYEPAYYLQQPREVLYIWQGGMAFVGGVIGVIVALLFLARRVGLKKQEFVLLGDIILCIVPLGSMLGRIGNYLNQELWGLPLEQLPSYLADSLTSLGLARVYDRVDGQLRVNTNILQSLLEGASILIVTWLLMFGRYVCGRIQPGMITGTFFIMYGVFRFLVEFVKDLPRTEMWGVLSATQWIMFGFVAVGMYFWRYALRK